MNLHGDHMWVARVSSMLREGFGAEDIALRLRCPLSAVRGEVMLLRAEGHLKTMFARPQGRTDSQTLKKMRTRRVT
jgi:hypothetical protein